MANKKTKKVRSTKKSRITIDELHYGAEPASDFFEGKDIKQMTKYFNWYNYMWDRKTSDRVVMAYAKEHGYKNASKLKKVFVPQTTAYIIRGMENGLSFPVREDGTTWREQVHKVLREFNKKAGTLHATDIDPASTVVKKRKTVQENIDAKVVELLGEVDHAIDIWDCEKFDMYSYLTDNKVSAAVATKIPPQYEYLVKEMTEAIEGKDEQLKEGYSHLNKTEKKAFLSFVKKIISDAEKYSDNNKPIRKPRKAKAISATNQVKDLNFLDHDTVNQVKSIDPSKIIGSKQLWLFNSKTNEIIKYDQADRAGLAVKGTTILNFDSKISGSKKLGVKTEQVLDRVLEGGTITLNKVMSEINSKSSVVTGRINNNMIILKVD